MNTALRKIEVGYYDPARRVHHRVQFMLKDVPTEVQAKLLEVAGKYFADSGVMYAWLNLYPPRLERALLLRQHPRLHEKLRVIVFSAQLFERERPAGLIDQLL